MSKRILPLIICSLLAFAAKSQTLVYHTIVTDSNHNLLPWYNANPGTSYDHDLGLIWNFWKNIPAPGGQKYYMADHSWCSGGCSNKVGGDQFAMLLSSWALYYAYTGDTDLVKDMTYIANIYLQNSLSYPNYSWPNIPFPCNYSMTNTAYYDGDFILGVNVTQPDKAGSFGYELVNLYKITRDTTYLHAATNIANVLAAKVQPGDSANSPYPFKVNALNNAHPLSAEMDYTTNFVPTLRLFESLKNLNHGNVTDYDSATAKIQRWIRQYPLQTNNWGCFFEDIASYSNTEINAVTMAHYIMEHPQWSNTWQQDARGILDWVLTALRSHAYDTIGVTAIYEQSADLKEGGSHTSRFASMELLYSELTGDTSRVAQAIRQLNWATYLCDTSGLVRFSPAEGSVWYTDGYGDYVRHYLRAMAAYPTIAPDYANHLLRSTSVVSYIKYLTQEINYTTFDNAATETFRLTSKPLQVKVDGGGVLNEVANLNAEGWTWQAYPVGGVLKVRHDNSHSVDVLWNTSGITTVENDKNELEVFPNPAKGVATIHFTTTAQQAVKMQLIDAMGRSVKEFAFNALPQLNQQELNVADVAAGVYLLQLNTTQGPLVKKLMVGK